MHRRRRAIAIAAVLALLTLLAWVASRGAIEAALGAAVDPPGASSGGGSGAATPSDAGTLASGAAAGPDGGVAVARSLEPVRLSAATVRRDPSAAVGTLSGRVVSFAGGRPIAGAVLSFEHEGRTTSVESDAEGRFVLAPSELGTYALAIATADGFLPFAPEWGHSAIRFEARPGAHVEGIVVFLVDALEIVATVVRGGEDGAPIPVAPIPVEGAIPVAPIPVEGAEVWIHGAERGERALAPLAARHRTDARGEVRFVAPDDSVIEASHAEHGRGRAVLDTAAQVTHRMTIRLERETPATMRGDRRIAGTVVDTEGAPIAGALVVASYEARRGSAEAALHPPLESETDDEGRFTLAGADEGRYRLLATAADHARAVLEGVAAGRADVVVRMRAGARLRVRVLGEAGAPIAASTVVVERATGPLTREALALASSYDAEGTIEIGGLEPGPCLVIASATGYAPSEPVDAIAREGDVAEVEVRLARGARIVGRVVSGSPEGAPLEGARATLEGRLGSGPSAVALETSALTDHDGRFAIAGVAPGLRSIVVWAADHHGRVRSGLEVSGGELDVGTIDLGPVEDGETPRLELAGIGAVLAAEGDAMVIGRVVEGGGAAEAGLVEGDGILAVEGVPVTELGFQGTIERIRGPEGTIVTLRVRRAGGDVETLVVPRRRIRA